AYLENADRFQTVVVKNVGDAPGDYRVDLVDLKMRDDGAVVNYDAGETPQYSAVPYLRIAPKSMTLKPGETQNIRIILRKPDNLEPGEYRAHMRVLLVHENAAASGLIVKGQQITVRPNLAVTIPIILRNGKTTSTMSIDAPKLSRD